MNRYTYRAKILGSHEKWACGTLIYSNTIPAMRIVSEKGIVEEHLICKNTIEQCTGCRDINGKFIFEGDIILTTAYGKEEYENEYYRIVEWGEENAEFVCRPPLGVDYEPVWFLDSQAYIEVVGNIQDNYELIEELIEKEELKS